VSLDAYQTFLARKAVTDPATGMREVPSLPDAMFPFQRDIVSWALRRGRAAIFAGTGLGKSFMELAWGRTVADQSPGAMVLLLAPLAVSAQLLREADKFGVPARLVRTQDDCAPGINITNYQKLEHFDLTQFLGVILDEASILKSSDGHYKAMLIAACASVPFRLSATATPAPNDFMELGNQADFLGVMSHTDMLATFFAHDGGETQKWRLKGHAENEFWKWMASWSVMLRKPSDLGYDDTGYDLLPLHRHSHVVASEGPTNGMLFAMQAETLQERIGARRETVGDRVAKAIDITPDDRPFVWWCQRNDESEMLARAIPGAVETKGSDPDDVKERKLLDFVEGRTRVLITKPKVAGFGMNFQCCADTGFVGLNDSFEEVYQAVRRFWRFGQTKPVNAHFISADIEGAVMANLARKEADADRMAAGMIQHMGDLSSMAVRGSLRDTPDYNPQQSISLPHWLRAVA
jgi:hypothetical protein